MLSSCVAKINSGMFTSPLSRILWSREPVSWIQAIKLKGQTLLHFSSKYDEGELSRKDSYKFVITRIGVCLEARAPPSSLHLIAPLLLRPVSFKEPAQNQTGLPGGDEG